MENRGSAAMSLIVFYFLNQPSGASGTPSKAIFALPSAVVIMIDAKDRVGDPRGSGGPG